MRISEGGGVSNWEIVSFRSCVRCEAVCERETDEISVARVAHRFTTPGRGGGVGVISSSFGSKTAPFLHEIIIFG